MACKPVMFTTWPVQKTFANPCDSDKLGFVGWWVLSEMWGRGDSYSFRSIALEGSLRSGYLERDSKGRQQSIR